MIRSETILTLSLAYRSEERSMDRYQCTVCGFIYDPVKGDPDGNIAPGTAFEDIPDDWVCPICGEVKARFHEI